MPNMFMCIFIVSLCEMYAQVQASSLITKLTEEKNSAIQLSNKLQKELVNNSLDSDNYSTDL